MTYTHRSVASLPMVMVGLMLSPIVDAAVLVGPATATVNPGDTAEPWQISQGGALTVNPAGQTLQIYASDSAVTLNGATVTSVSDRALELSGASATAVVSDSTLVTSEGTTVTVGRGSLASFSDSQLSGVSRGFNVLNEGQLNVRNTQVNVTGDGSTTPLGGGAGLVMLSGETTLSEGSIIVGANNGAAFSNDLPSLGDSALRSTLVVDASTVQGVAGSGLVVFPLRNASPQVDVTLRNGSLLSGGNGVAADLFAGTVMVLSVDASDIQGALNTGVGSELTVDLANGSTLNGASNVNNQAVMALNADASLMTGDISVQDGGDALVAFRNGARLVGSVQAITPVRTSVLLDNSHMDGNLTATGANTELTLQNAATLTGFVQGATRMSLNSGSVWNMSQDSRVGAMTVASSRVNLNGAVGAFHTLTMDSLTGAGTFALNTDLANLQGDKLVVTGTAEGSHILDVASTGAEPKAGDSGLTVVNTGGGAASFALATGQVDAGTYVYDLAHQNDDWVLVQRDPGTPVDPVTPVDPGTPVDPVTPVDPGVPVDPGIPGGGGPEVTPSARAVLGLFSAAPTVWYGETTTLRSRMGELRTGRQASGPWVRAFAGQYNLSAGGGVAYRQQQSGISFGVDAPLPIAEGQWMIGVMGGYSRANLDLKAGTDGHVDSYYAGIYSTWLDESGYYIDALVKANRFQNRSDVLMSDGRRAGGDYDNYGVGGSVEVGKHIKLPADWFVEPFAQVSALWVQGEQYGLDNGMQARSNHANSLTGKIGTHLGRTIQLADGGVLQPYLKVAAAQEFAKANKVRINDTYSFNNDLSGGRIEVGAGIIAQLSEAVQLHGDVDYGNGRNIEQPWGVSFGVRYAW